VQGPLLLPNNVLLKGAGIDLTAIYFASDNETTAPKSYFSTAPHESVKYVKYGVEDLAVCYSTLGYNSHPKFHTRFE